MLSCPACLREFSGRDPALVPRNLNCGHTFCSSCLHKQAQNGFIQCGYGCATETPVPSRSATSLPLAHAVLGMLDHVVYQPSSPSSLTGNNNNNNNNNNFHTNKGMGIIHTPATSVVAAPGIMGGGGGPVGPVSVGGLRISTPGIIQQQERGRLSPLIIGGGGMGGGGILGPMSSPPPQHQRVRRHSMGAAIIDLTAGGQQLPQQQQQQQQPQYPTLDEYEQAVRSTAFIAAAGGGGGTPSGASASSPVALVPSPTFQQQQQQQNWGGEMAAMVVAGIPSVGGGGGSRLAGSPTGAISIPANITSGRLRSDHAAALQSNSPNETFFVIRDNFNTLQEVQQALQKAGLESSNLIVGIDYTKSNTWTGARTFGGRCLHFIDAKGQIKNPYQSVVSVIGRTLEIFDDDNLIPAFGFGDLSTLDKSCFPFYRDGSPCQGFQGVLQRYNEITPSVVLAGPTNFAPVIREAIKIVSETQQYHILLIIADGQVTARRETEQAIVEASDLPLSIIVVGVGDGPWETMVEMDDGLPARRFDNFQFVNYDEIASKYPPDRLDAAFATAALMEIPDQFKCIKELGMFDHEED